jgi:hypothetical protein
MKRITVVSTLLALVAPTALLVGAAPTASAIPLCEGSGTVKGKASQKRVATTKSLGRYNNTKSKVTLTLAWRKTDIKSTATSFQVKGKVSAGYGPVKAQVESKYGKDSFRSEKISKSEKVTMKISPKHTGWSEYNWYLKVRTDKRWTFVYSPTRKTCIKQWSKYKVAVGKPWYLSENVERKGRVNPANF